MPAFASTLASLLLTAYGAALLAAAIILLAEWRGRGRPPSVEAVRHIAERYRALYGDRAAAALAEHRIGASLWARRQDRELLQLVLETLAAEDARREWP